MAITKRKAERQVVSFVKIDALQKKVWGVVYSPMSIDAHGDIMTAKEIENAAHGFLHKADLATAADENHNHIPTYSKIIESSIVRVDGDIGPVGSWVVGMHIPNAGIWRKIERGEITGYSFEGSGYKRKAKVTATRQKYKLVYTDAAPDGHKHLAFVELDDGGRVLRGHTGETNGHKHVILSNTITEIGESHRHRIILNIS